MSQPSLIYCSRWPSTKWGDLNVWCAMKLVYFYDIVTKERVKNMNWIHLGELSDVLQDLVMPHLFPPFLRTAIRIAWIQLAGLPPAALLNQMFLGDRWSMVASFWLDLIWNQRRKCLQQWCRQLNWHNSGQMGEITIHPSIHLKKCLVKTMTVTMTMMIGKNRTQDTRMWECGLKSCEQR